MKGQTGYLGIPFTLVWMPVATPPVVLWSELYSICDLIDIFDVD